MKLATWNINSVRLRLQIIIDFIKKNNIDVLCLQETKTEDKFFPCEYFEKNGFSYQYLTGQKSYNGVAILSKIPIIKKFKIEWCGVDEARHISVKLKNKITIHNFYIPAGGDIPDPKINLKFKHKLCFLEEVINYFENDKTKNKILVGDLNIAPDKNDVWSHKQLANVVSYTPIERELLNKLVSKGRWVDIVRLNHKFDEKLFTWWSYRNKDWKKSNRGRRLDHIFVSKDLVKKIKITSICSELRGIEKPSDHVPVTIEFNE